MRTEIIQLEQLGQLPPEREVTLDRLKVYEKLLHLIGSSVSNDEARVIAKLFGQNHDSCFGIAWRLIHLIETAPDWPLKDCLKNPSNVWINVLRGRAI